MGIQVTVRRPQRDVLSADDLVESVSITELSQAGVAELFTAAEKTVGNG